MLVSLFFSAGFYQVSNRELQRLINRLEFEQQTQGIGPARPLGMRFLAGPSIDDLRELQRRSLFTLGIINVGIFIFSGAAGYFLAGKTLEPIKKMVEEQEEFITHASHELRTPLAILRAEMEGHLLEKRLTDAQARSLIASNLEEVAHLQTLSHRLLQALHVQRPLPAQKKTVFSLLKTLRTVSQKMKTVADVQQIQLSLSGKDAFIRGSEMEVVEVFTILLDNAIKYSPQGKSVRVSVIALDGQVRVCVRDEGPGIAAQDLPYIFRRFYRSAENKDRVQGYGLGLAIAKKIVREHGGEIAVKNTHPGAEFSVQFPRVLSHRS